jgi:hypothetical protein
LAETEADATLDISFHKNCSCAVQPEGIFGALSYPQLPVLSGLYGIRKLKHYFVSRYHACKTGGSTCEMGEGQSKEEGMKMRNSPSVDYF